MFKTPLNSEFLWLNLLNKEAELDGEEMDAILTDLYPEDIKTLGKVRTDRTQMA
jgi:hypothetical protein